MKIRDRIREFRRVPAAELRPNPQLAHAFGAATQRVARRACGNWLCRSAARSRTARRIAGIDRRSSAQPRRRPTCRCRFSFSTSTKREADKILATHDPLANLAGVDSFALQSLLADVQTDNDALQSLFTELAQDNDLKLADSDGDSPARDVAIPRLFQVVVECGDESEQESLYERLVAEDFKCRLLTL